MNTKALLVLDMINEICDENGFLGKQSYFKYMSENNVDKKINKLIEQESLDATIIIFVNLGFSMDYREKPKHSPIFNYLASEKLFIKNTWGTRIVDKINLPTNSLIINKYQVSAFTETLTRILFNNGIEELIICGVSTHLAIESTVRQAHDLGYLVSVYEDCCIAANEEEHINSINSFRNFCNILKLNN